MARARPRRARRLLPVDQRRRQHGPPWDYFHINAVSQHGGDLLVDSRNTWAAYELDARSGQIVWRLGGKQSSFAMGPGATPAWQHDAREEPDGTISFFDNGGTPKVHPQSRGDRAGAERADMTATLVSSFVGPAPLLAASQGDLQPLPDGNWMVGWGQEPYFSEFSPTGPTAAQRAPAGRLPVLHRAEVPLVGDPGAAAAARAARGASGGRLLAYMSWNGATAVARWQLLAGARANTLSPRGLGRARRLRDGDRDCRRATPYVAAQALGAQGEVLGTSALARG